MNYLILPHGSLQKSSLYNSPKRFEYVFECVKCVSLRMGYGISLYVFKVSAGGTMVMEGQGEKYGDFNAA